LGRRKTSVGWVKTTCRLFDGINRKGNVVVSDPISPQITGKAATRHISNTVIMVRGRCNQALTGS